MLTLPTMSCISLVFLMMSLVRLSLLLIMRSCRCLTHMITQRLRLPSSRTSTLSSDFRLSVCDFDVFVKASSTGLFVICSGWIPARVGDVVLPSRCYTFRCDTYDECVRLFLDLSKELLRRVPYV